MSDDRKYRHRGYMDSGREESGRRPSGPRPPRPEGPRGRGVDLDKAVVFTCRACGCPCTQGKGTEMESPNAQATLEPDPEEKPRPHPPDSLRRILEKLFHGDFHIPRRPARRALLVLLAVSAAVLLWRAGQRSF